MILRHTTSSPVNKILRLLEVDELELLATENGYEVDLFGKSGLVAEWKEEDKYSSKNVTLALTAERLTLADLESLLKLNSSYHLLYSFLEFSNVNIVAKAAEDHDRETLIISGDLLEGKEQQWHFLGFDFGNDTPLSRLRLKVRLSHKKGSFRKHYQVQIEADLKVGTQTVSVALELPLGYEGLWTMRLLPPGITVGFGDLEKLFHGFATKSLIEAKVPDQERRSFTLEHLNLKFIPSMELGASKFVYLDFGVSSTLNWELFGSYSLNHVSFRLSVNKDGSSTSYATTISGTFGLGIKYLFATISLPEKGDATLTAHTAPNNPQTPEFADFGGLLSDGELTDHLPPNLPEQGLDITLNELKIVWNWGDQEIKSFMLNLTVQCDEDWIVWKKKSKPHHLVLNSFGLNLELSRSSMGWQSQGYISGGAAIEGIAVGVRLDKSLKGEWKIYLTNPIEFSPAKLKSITQVDLEDEDNGYLPSGFVAQSNDTVVNTILREFRVHFNLSPWALTYVSFHVESNGTLELFNGIQLSDAVCLLQINHPFDTDLREIKAAQLAGKLGIGHHNIYLVSEKNSINSDWSFNGKSEPGDKISFLILFATMLKPFGIAIDAESLPEMSVSNLDLTYIPGQKHLAFSGQSRLSVTDLFSSEITLDMESTEGENPQLDFTGSGYLRVGDVIFSLDASYTSIDEKGWRFESSLDEELSVLDLIRDGLQGKHELPASLFNHFSIRNVAFISEPRVKHFLLKGESSLGLTIFKSWNVAIDLSFQVTREAVTRHAPAAPLTYDVSGKGTLTTPSGVTMEVTAKTLADHDGWLISSTLQEGTLTLTDLKKEAGDDAFDLPDWFLKLKVDELEANFNTYNKDFTFAFQSELPVFKQEALLIAASVERRHEESLHTKFAGSISIGEQEFRLFLDNARKGNWLLGVYKNTSTLEVALSDLMAVLPPWEINLHEAMFAYHQNSQQILFNANLGSGITLTKIPLIGKFLSGSKIKLDCRMNLATGEFSSGAWEALNEIRPSDMEKVQAEDFIEGFSLNVVLSFDGNPIQLSVPIAVTEEGEQQHIELHNQQTSAQNDPPEIITEEQENGPDVKWKSVQKAFGPIHLERIGWAYEEQEVRIKLDGGLKTGGLLIELSGLTCMVDLKPLTQGDYNLQHQTAKFHLDGMEVDFKKGLLEVGASLLREAEELYNGTALLRFKQLSIGAIASYTTLDEHPSMFIYAAMNMPLGGPPFFFVTGLSAGFGYNRKLVVPAVDHVREFPLVAEAMAGKAIPATANHHTLMEELKGIKAYVPPSKGDVFLAAGVNFTTFQLIDSTLLLTASFGHQMEFNLLGVSTVSIPPRADRPLAYLQMQIKGSYLPDDGFVGLTGQLTKEAYLFSQACHLTGGFAFYSWFGGAHEGDFVMTMGGYHPQFQVPEHYPTVPRVGFNWVLKKDVISIKGDSYFALCAHALMAGGHLEASYDYAHLHAYFNLAADFLVMWKPFHYEASVHTHIGGSYTYHFFGKHHISVDVGADVEIWGPEFGGKASVDLYVTSLEIEFGEEKPKQPALLSWEEFTLDFLPTSNWINVTINDGLLIGEEQTNESTPIRLDSQNFSLHVDLALPVNKFKDWTSSQELGIRPMGLDTFESELTVIIKHGRKEVTDQFELNHVLKSVPTALWSPVQKATINENRFIQDTLMGLEIRSSENELATGTYTLTIEQLVSGENFTKPPEPVTWSFELVEQQQGVSDESEGQLLSFDTAKFSDTEALSMFNMNSLEGSLDTAYYHGPLVPAGKSVKFNYPIASSAALEISKKGDRNCSYSLSWELGRLLAINHTGFSASLRSWRLHQKRMNHHVRQKERMNTHHLDGFRPPIKDNADAPDSVRAFLTGLQALEGVPFHYLVQQETSLPLNALRIFKIDQTWISALLEGAMSICQGSSREQEAHTISLVEELVGTAEYSGFLLRSDQVPALRKASFAGFDKSNTSLELVRYDRIGLNVVIGVFKGAVAHIEVTAF